METSRYGYYFRSLVGARRWNCVINFNTRWPMRYLLSILLSSQRLAQVLSFPFKSKSICFPSSGGFHKYEFNNGERKVGIRKTFSSFSSVSQPVRKTKICDRLASRWASLLSLQSSFLLSTSRRHRTMHDEEDKHLHNKLLWQRKFDEMCFLCALEIRRKKEESFEMCERERESIEFKTINQLDLE